MSPNQSTKVAKHMKRLDNRLTLGEITLTAKGGQCLSIVSSSRCRVRHGESRWDCL